MDISDIDYCRVCGNIVHNDFLLQKTFDLKVKGNRRQCELHPILHYNIDVILCEQCLRTSRYDHFPDMGNDKLTFGTEDQCNKFVSHK